MTDQDRGREREPRHARTPPVAEIGLSVPLGDPGLAGAKIHLTIEFPAASEGASGPAETTNMPIRVQAARDMPPAEYTVRPAEPGGENADVAEGQSVVPPAPSVDPDPPSAPVAAVPEQEAAISAGPAFATGPGATTALTPAEDAPAEITATPAGTTSFPREASALIAGAEVPPAEAAAPPTGANVQSAVALTPDATAVDVTAVAATTVDATAVDATAVAATTVVGAPVSATAASPWYFPALGGIRGLIVLGVMLFHSNLVGQGLFFAVDLFFIVSGFVIVLQLLRRLDTSGKISARVFLGRRIKRIMPPLLITLALTMLLTWGFGTLQETQSAGTLGLWSLAQLANWYEIVSGDAYWSMTGLVQPLAHMWSLSILEQFYLVWPGFLALLWWLSRKRLGVVVGIIGVLCVASGFIAPLLWDGDNADRLYLGTDTRLVAVLAGALGGALVYLILRSRIGAAQPGGKLWPSLIGALGLAGLVIGGAFGDSYTDPWLYQGGFAVAAACGGAFTASLAFRGNVLGRVIGWSPFQVLGRVSYEMYLLHLPLFWLIQKLTPGISPLALFVSGALTTWLLAAIVHYAFAEPWRLARWTWRRGIPIFLVAVLTVVALSYGLPRLREAQMGDAARTDAAALPVEPGAAGGRPVVLTVGDSISRDFATALSDYGSHAFAVVDAGIGGCGLMSPDKVRAASGYVFAQQQQCGSWTDSVSEALAKNAPDIVLVHSAWDAADQHVDGKWLTSCDAEYRTRYLAELGTLLDLVDERAPGAQVVFSNDRTTSKVIDDPKVMTCYESILAEVVKARPGVHLLDLGGHLCPGERCLTQTPEGSPIFLRDDLHFTEGGLTWLAPWLEQELAAVQHDARATTGDEAEGDVGPAG